MSGQAIFGSPIKELEGEQISLSTAEGYLLTKPSFHEVKLYCASAWRLALSPKLEICQVYTNASTSYADYISEALDRDDGTHVPLNAMTSSDWLYLGTNEVPRGFYILMNSNKNTVNTTLDIEYSSTAIVRGVAGTPDTALAFSNVASISDGTKASGTDTFGQSGVITFTLPAAVKTTLGTLVAPTHGEHYWIRIAPLATLDDPVDVLSIIPVYKNTNYAYMEAGVEYQFSINIMKVGGLVFKAVSGTPNLDVTWIRH